MYHWNGKIIIKFQTSFIVKDVYGHALMTYYLFEFFHRIEVNPIGKMERMLAVWRVELLD